MMAARHLRGLPLLVLGATLALGTLACATSAPPVVATPAAAPIVDPPRQPGRPLALVVMPDSDAFRSVRRALVNEIKNDLDVKTRIIDAKTTAAEFAAEVDASGAALLVLMDNPTVRLYRAYQNSRKDRAAVIPAVVVMSSFLEELRAELTNASGVAYEVPGVTAFVQLRSVIQRPVRRVGVVHRPAFAPFLERQKLLAGKEQITLVPARVPADPTPADVQKALASLRGADIDALWVLNDNGLLRDADFLQSAWRSEIAAMEIPVVVGVPTLVTPEARFGTFAVLPDLDALGVQAGNVVLDVAENDWQARDHAVELPISTLTWVNMRQLRERFGLREGAPRRIDRALE